MRNGGFGAVGYSDEVADDVRALLRRYKEGVWSMVPCSDATRPTFCNLSVSRCPLPAPLPFPSIFGNLVGRKGEMLSNPASDSLYRGSLDIHAIPVVTSWRSWSAILPFISYGLIKYELLLLFNCYCLLLCTIRVTNSMMTMLGDDNNDYDLSLSLSPLLKGSVT